MAFLSSIRKQNWKSPRFSQKTRISSIQTLCDELVRTFEAGQEPGSGLDQQTHLETLRAIEDRISRTPACNITDAIVPVMLAISLLERIEERLADDGGDTQRRIQSLLISALNFLADEAGTKLHLYGADILLPPGQGNWRNCPHGT